MRIRLKQERDLYPKRGFGLYYEAGCLGSTYGEPGTNHFYCLYLVLLLWTFSFRLSWKQH